MASSDDDLPPLQDFTSHFVEPQKKTKSSEILDGADRSDLSNLTTKKQPVQKTTAPTQLQPEKPKPKPKNTGFGGLSKGFLNNPPPKRQPKKAVVKKKSPNSEIIKPTHTQTNSLKFDEIQDQPDSNFTKFINDTQKEWLNDDLLNTVGKDKSLISSLNDPETSKALEFMQRDPKGAIEYYKQHDPSKLEMIMKMTGLLGNHMSNLETKNNVKNQRINQKNEILEKPKIKELIHYLKHNPERANYMIRSEGHVDEEFKEDVRILLASGDLKLDGTQV